MPILDRYTTNEVKLLWLPSKEMEMDHEVPLAKFTLDKNIRTGDCTKNFSTGTYNCLEKSSMLFG